MEHGTMQVKPGQQDVAEPTARHAVGEPVLRRFVRPATLEHASATPYFAVPMRVVRDDAGLIMLFTAAGSTIRKRVHADGAPIPRDMPYAERLKLDTIVGEGAWAPFHTLSIIPAGAPYDIRCLWHQDDWSFAGWYVNLQAPLQRVPTGFDSNDWLLDLTAGPDGAWEWKDEDELADAVAAEAVTEAFAASVRAAGESVIPLIESRAWPFDGSLVDWRPAPAWRPLPVPDGWNVLSEVPAHE